jgi:TM2 domain-containing membrane protein YozV
MNEENTNPIPPEPEVPAPEIAAPEDLVPPVEDVMESELVPTPFEGAAPVPPAPAASPAEPYAEPAPVTYSPPPPPPPSGEPYAPPAPAAARGGAAEKNKLVAGVLGILLGGLGVHKFYLGYTKEGLIMLAGNLLWIVGMGWVPNVVGLVEGVMYLFKSDQEFYDTYVVGSKPWL